MNFLPRLLGLGLLGLLMGLLVMSCESTRGTGEFGTPTRIKGEVIAKPDSRQIAQVTDSTLDFKTPRAELAAAFIREFGDGTVVDKILVRKAPAGPKDPSSYFLVGMGLRGGSFRAMALPLNTGGDNTVYLRPSAERYILTAVGCPTCYFNFENGRIVGTSCGDNSGGSRCDLKVEMNNNLFAAR
jgi:hypothetical protein